MDSLRELRREANLDNRYGRQVLDTIVICSDQQARYDDRVTGEAFYSFLSDFRPTLLVNNGDLFDFESLGTFRKTLVERASLMEDVRAGLDILMREAGASPRSRIILIEGNHEERLTRYLLDNAEALSTVPGLQVSEFLDLEDLGVEYVGPYGKGIDWHGVEIYHGALVRSDSAYTAKAEFLQTGTSGVSGHTHRLGAYYKSDGAGPHAWYEGGCLCNVVGENVPPDARGPRVRNAQQGFLYGYATSDIWNLYQVHITNHQFIVEGKLYAPRGYIL